MPLLYDDEALTGEISNKERDVELRLAKGPDEEAGDVRLGAESVGELGAVVEAGDGDRFFRPKGEAGDLEVNYHVQLAAPSRSESTTTHIPTEGTITTPSIQQTRLSETNDNHIPNPAGSTSFASSTITLMDDHGAGTTTGLPSKRYVHAIRSTRWRILNVYRRLHLLVLIPNVIAMIVIGTHNHPGLLETPVTQLAAAATANILLSVLMRQELVINVLFIIFGHCPKWFPLRFRQLSAKIYHLGGVHSGAGVAGTIWFIVATAGIFNIDHDSADSGVGRGIRGVTIALDVLLVTIVALSYPSFRRTYHDWWEWIHRFFGWAAIGAFWGLFFMLTITYKKDTPEPQMWKAVISSPIFWMLVVITCCIVAPWLNLRKVPVTAEQLSNHVVRLHFTYATPPLCSAPRLSDKPLREWHAFASIPEDSGPGFSVLVSAAGDWTKRIIKDPPKYLWKRGWLARGVLNVAPIFKSMIIVVTGSGIGPVLSLLKGAPNIRNVRLLWSTKDPVLHYGQAVLDDVRATDPEAVIINTTVDERPNLLETAHSMYVDSGAEAVFVISNPGVTRQVVYGLECRGVPAFAPIFDS